MVDRGLNLPFVIARGQPLALWRTAPGMIFLAAVLLVPRAVASSLEATTEAQDFAAATGVCRGRVISVEAFLHPARGGIFTRARIEVLESIKGSFPKSITLVQRGGVIGNEGESTGLGVDFRPGDVFLLHVGRRTDGSLAVLRGSDGAALLGSETKAAAPEASGRLARLRKMVRPKTRAVPISSGEDFAEVQGFALAANSAAADSAGLLLGAGIPSRLTGPDRGEPVGYLVDAQTLPAGITQTAALQAVSNALAAWSSVTSVTFRFDGLANFGAAPVNVMTEDGRLRIALHDLYNEIAEPGVLGLGGRSYRFSAAFELTGGDGGAVRGLEFHRTTRAYVTLNHRAATMQNPASFEQVLCHEIGHALGLAHSSENPAEADPVLREAIMYYRIHGDGRGAALGAYDIPAVRKVHPHDDTPPFSDNRILTLVTASSPVTGIPGINELRLAAHDLQTPSSSLSIVTDGPAEGSAATSGFVGNLLRVTQTGGYSDGTVDPASTSYYYRKYVRFSDGTNASPWSSVRVVAIRRDSQGDGLPDSWSVQHFGTPTPSAPVGNRPGDDPDKDGFTNLQEFLLGTIPVNADSRLAVRSFDGQTIQWNASPYALYTLESSTNLATWLPFGLPVVPVSTNASTLVDLLPSASPKKFLRVRFGHPSP